MNLQLKQLQSGAKILFAPMPATDAVTVMFLFGVGSRYEKAADGGMAHFIEHMMFKGTKKRPKQIDISIALDKIGAQFNAFTSKEYTGYYANSSADNFSAVTEILADMLKNSRFAANEIEREKGVITEELRMNKDTPMRHILDLFENTLFGETPLGYSIGGTEKTVNSVTRPQMMKYYKDHYRTNNLLVVVAGNFNTAKVTQEINNKLRGFPEGKVLDPIPYKRIHDAPTFALEYKETNQAHIALGFPSLNITDSRVPTADILDSILGGMMSSRLFIEVRERLGLAYYVRAMSEPYLDTGAFIVQAGLNPKKTVAGIKAIQKELINITKKKISAAELNKAKEHIKGHLILELETSGMTAQWLGLRTILTGDLTDMHEYLDAIQKVTVAQVQELAQEIFSKPQTLAIIGPYKKEDDFKKLIEQKLIR
ncbi:M16 family metallopeptidase [Patescibacteria group bacterium]